MDAWRGFFLYMVVEVRFISEGVRSKLINLLARQLDL